MRGRRSATGLADLPLHWEREHGPFSAARQIRRQNDARRGNIARRGANPVSNPMTHSIPISACGLRLQPIAEARATLVIMPRKPR